MAFGVAALKEHFWCSGIQLIRSIKQANLSPIYLQTPWAGEEKAVRPKDQRGRTFNVHTTGSINYWRNGKSSYNLLQEIGCYAEWEKGCSLYSKMIGWICCRMSFSLVRASVMSIRGARSSATKGALHKPIELQAAEGQLKASFRLSSLWLQGFVMSKLYVYFSFLYLYCHYNSFVSQLLISYIHFFIKTGQHLQAH